MFVASDSTECHMRYNTADCETSITKPDSRRLAADAMTEITLSTSTYSSTTFDPSSSGTITDRETELHFEILISLYNEVTQIHAKRYASI